MPRIELNITSWDIRESRRTVTRECPVTRAFNKHGYNVWVNRHCTYVDGKNGECEISHTAALAKFIADFADGKPVKPFKATVQWKAK